MDFDNWFKSLLDAQETDSFRNVLKRCRKELHSSWDEDSPVWTAEELLQAKVWAKEIRELLFGASDEKQLHMMKHAWGYDTHRPGFRTHYVTEAEDFNMLDLVGHGYFKKGPVGAEACLPDGEAYFYLTDKAINLLKLMKEEESK
jgi:hypothetical protein